MLFRRRPAFDVISIGDSVLDHFLRISDASVSCKLNHEECLLCLPCGEKLPLKSLTRIPGAGNASNVAIGASRLGWKSAIVSIVGHDAVGHEILDRWQDERVDTRFVHEDHAHPTNQHTVLDFQDERTILIFHQPRKYHLPKLSSTKWIYYTSLGKGHEILEKELLRHLAGTPDIKLGFNPGTYQLQRGLKKLLPVFERCTTLFVNKQEAQRLLATQEENTLLLLSGLRRHGPSVVVITDGPTGSYASDGKETLFCPPFPGKAVERTGAGDSFAMGFMHGYEETGSLAEALRTGSAVSAQVVLQVGPHAGLPTLPALEKLLRTHKKIHPRSPAHH